MKNSKTKKVESAACSGTCSVIQLFSYSVVILLFSHSCTHMYDNVKEFADAEIVYVEKFDGIINVQYGFERVEIDLLRIGRIPASQIRMAKATRTVIECEDFTEPGHRRVIDSICSWVNVTGLTQLKYYELTIYTEDDYGNRSLPFKTNVKPYTAENLNTIEFVPPAINASTSTAQIEWLEGLSALTHEVISYRWQYTDKSGAVITGEDDGDKPVLFLENLTSAVSEITLTLMCKIIPKYFESNNRYTSILDVVDFQTTINIKFNLGTEAIIFLKSPASGMVKDVSKKLSSTFMWVKINDVNGYTLKFSKLPSFPEGETYSINAGNVNEYTLSDADLQKDILASFSSISYELDLFWTVIPTEKVVPVKMQYRLLKITGVAGFYFKYDRSAWTAVAASSTIQGDDWDFMDGAFDGDLGTLWHTAAVYTKPNWLVIDMKTPINISKFEIFRQLHPIYGDTKTVELYIGDSPEATSDTWTKIGSLMFPSGNSWEVPSMEAITTDNVTTGRYLKLSFPDTYRDDGAGPYVNVVEIYVYGLKAE